MKYKIKTRDDLKSLQDKYGDDVMFRTESDEELTLPDMLFVFDEFAAESSVIEVM